MKLKWIAVLGMTILVGAGFAWAQTSGTMSGQMMGQGVHGMAPGSASGSMMPGQGTMMTRLNSMSQRLDSLVRQMNSATGKEKIDAMATVVTELANQLTQWNGRMGSMHSGMMMGSMQNMHGGTSMGSLHGDLGGHMERGRGMTPPASSDDAPSSMQQ